MLRRNFIKATALTVGGFFILRRIPFAKHILPEEKEPVKPYRPVYHLHGHPRSGCASRPELAPFLEKGFAVTPYL
ncbi:hypothetical protein TRIP_C20798 [Candidatus Zixiibacteriota bacterium]|nr:hypothetical protein TRIP_C20798 [candidate division Zixibacteria bacterium]